MQGSVKGDYSILPGRLAGLPPPSMAAPLRYSLSARLASNPARELCNRHERKKPPIGGFRRSWRSQRGSNPRFRRERAVSWATRRWDRLAEEPGLEPGKPGPEPGVMPFHHSSTETAGYPMGIAGVKRQSGPRRPGGGAPPLPSPLSASRRTSRARRPTP